MPVRDLRRCAFAALMAAAAILPATQALAQSPPLCSQYEVGSDRWIECVRDLATGGVDTGSDTSQACGEFPVGSPAWRECVEDAATGGGLMPWIVVIPLAVMVLVMFVIFGRRLLGQGRAKPFSASTMGRSAGGWLMFVGATELAMGAGFAVAASRAPGIGGGFFIAAAVLLGVGVILVLIGLMVWRRSGRTSRIEREGLPGTARILSLTQTGTYLNEQPQIAMELEVNVPGHPTFQTTHRSFVPLILLNRLAPGGDLPIKADPQKPTRVIVDWQGSRGGEQPAAAGVPGTPEAGTWRSPDGSVVVSVANAEEATAARGAGTRVSEPPWLANLSPDLRGTVREALARAGLQPADIPASRPGQATPTGGAGSGQAVDALASVRAIQDTGVAVEGGKVMVLDLALLIPGQAERKVRHPATVPTERVNQLVVGLTLPIGVDPDDPSQLYVDWDRL
jgi:hypothetical protein